MINSFLGNSTATLSIFSLPVTMGLSAICALAGPEQSDFASEETWLAAFNERSMAGEPINE
jgi:hypothetical protein